MTETQKIEAISRSAWVRAAPNFRDYSYRKYWDNAVAAAPDSVDRSLLADTLSGSIDEPGGWRLRHPR